MKEEIPQSVVVVELEIAPFNNAEQAKAWACGHGIPGLMSGVDTRGKGEIAISLSSLEKMLSGSAVRKSVTPAIHYAALMRVRDIIRESFVAEIHPDYKKVGGVRSVSNGVNPMLQIAVLYGAVSLAGIVYRAKTTLKLYRDPSMSTKAYSYEISNIEVLTGTARVVTLPNVRTSMDVSILLQGVRRVNGELLLDNVVMKSIIFKIRERIEKCKSSGDMFTMPDIDGCTVSNQELPCAGSVIYHSAHTVSLPDGRSVLIDYQSKDKSKTFSVVHDRSCIQVECSDHSNDFSDAWDEKC